MKLDLKPDLIFKDGCFEFESRGQRVRVPVTFTPRRQIGGRDDLLAKAIGLKAATKKIGKMLSVLDLTAGLGRDAFHLAQLGCEVTALERNITLAMALQEAWVASGRNESLRFIHREARDYLQALKEHSQPDVIFYDPMFPEKKKSALAGKESQLLQMLSPLARDDQSQEGDLLRVAIAHARLRTVVKRPLPAPVILPEPDIVFKGKAVRFDVYLSARA